MLPLLLHIKEAGKVRKENISLLSVSPTLLRCVSIGLYDRCCCCCTIHCLPHYLSSVSSVPAADSPTELNCGHLLLLSCVPKHILPERESTLLSLGDREEEVVVVVDRMNSRRGQNELGCCSRSTLCSTLRLHGALALFLLPSLCCGCRQRPRLWQCGTVHYCCYRQ